MDFAAFDADTPLGRFVAFVRVEPDMHEWEARQDAVSLIRAEFGANARLLGGAQHGDQLPSDAFCSRHAPGWGWLLRGQRSSLAGDAA